jgi:hypothetical protein
MARCDIRVSSIAERYSTTLKTYFTRLELPAYTSQHVAY